MPFRLLSSSLILQDFITAANLIAAVIFCLVKTDIGLGQKRVEAQPVLLRRRNTDAQCKDGSIWTPYIFVKAIL